MLEDIVINSFAGIVILALVLFGIFLIIMMIAVVKVLILVLNGTSFADAFREVFGEV